MKKLQYLLKNPWVETGIIVSMLGVVWLILFTPDRPSLKDLTTHAFEAVLIFLGSAMLFMVLNRPRIMFSCLALCAVLCLFLKAKSNSGIQTFFNTSEQEFSICQVVINYGADEFESLSNRLVESEADILNIQELTPEWSLILKKALQEQYPYQVEIKRIDPYGMMVFSRYPILDHEVLMYSDTSRAYQIPLLKLKMNIKDDTIQFFGCHVLPRMNKLDFDKVQFFLDSVALWAVKEDLTTLIAGDFNLTPWDFTLQKFITDTRLNLSQREPHLFVQPFEHILHSSSIICNKLKEVQTTTGSHLGIQGFYTFKTNAEQAIPLKKY
jgi:hypothetical protein